MIDPHYILLRPLRIRPLIIEFEKIIDKKIESFDFENGDTVRVPIKKAIATPVLRALQRIYSEKWCVEVDDSTDTVFFIVRMRT